jgi:hypothetical protein
MVDISRYKVFIDWFKNRKEKFTTSDVRRESSLAPQTIDKILDTLIQTKKPYVKTEGEGTNRKYIKLRDIDLDFFAE